MILNFHLFTEALEVIDDVKQQIGNQNNNPYNTPHTRTKRENFSGEERRVAGVGYCICVNHR